MVRFILLAVAVHCSCVSATVADDYLLRIDTVGYVDRPAAEKHPKKTVLRSIEVIARPQSAFHGKTKIGAQQSLTLTGKLSPADNGKFAVQFRYVHSIDTGVTVPTEDGKPKPLLGMDMIQTSLTIALDESLTIGGLAQARSKNKSKVWYVLRLSKYTSPDD